MLTALEEADELVVGVAELLEPVTATLPPDADDDDTDEELVETTELLELVMLAGKLGTDEDVVVPYRYEDAEEYHVT